MRFAQRWLSLQVTAVLLAIVAAGVQCAAQCATAPCHFVASNAYKTGDHLPPCHRHAPPKQHAPAEPCRYLALSDAKISPVFDTQHLSGDSVAGFLIGFTPLTFQQTKPAIIFSITPPLSPHPPSFSVLRI